MEKYRIYIIFFIATFIFFSIPFFPEPRILFPFIHTFRVIQIFYLGFLILGLATILILVIVYIILRNQIIKRTIHSISKSCVLLVILIFNNFCTAEFFRKYSRSRAITNVEKVIFSLNEYKAKNGEYPEELSDLKSDFLKEIPSSGSMEIDGFYYEKRFDSFSICFSQIEYPGFSEEICEYGNIYAKASYLKEKKVSLPKNWHLYSFSG